MPPMAVPEPKLSPRIVDAERAAELNQSLIGGKAFNLARLTQAGLPVPPWFCVTTLVFGDTFSAITEEVGSVKTDASTIRAAARRIAEKAQTIRLSDRDRDALLGQFDAAFPGNAVVAVRSSAVGEDSAKDSFAGQLDTFLYVTRETLPERLIACFASAFSERVLMYRNLRTGNLAGIESAVVVQMMVEARAAGVTFTANPTTADETEMVVSAAYGLGEGVVAGLVECDTYFIDSETGRIREKHVIDKHSQIAFDKDTGSGTRMIAVSSDLSGLAVLSDSQLAALHSLCGRVRDFYRSPQDVEWAIDDSGKIHLLQARPITTLTRERESIFDYSNVVESYPGVSSPLTFSYARNGYAATFREGLRLLGVPNRVLDEKAVIHNNLIGLLQGRIYYNLLNWYRIFAITGFEWMLPAWEVALGLPRRYVRTPKRSLVEKLAGLRTKGCLAWHFLSIKREVARFVKLFREAYADFHRRDLSSLEAHDLVDLHDTVARNIRGPYGIYVINDALTQQLHSVLGKLIARFQLGDPVRLRNALLCGETGMESVEPVRSGVQLAEHIRSDAALLALFQSSAGVEEIWRSIHHDDRFIDFRRRLLKHLTLYGDRTLDELKLETPVAEDNPGFVVGILRNYLRGGQNVDSMESHEREIRSQAEETLSNGLRGHPLRRQLVHLVLRRVRAGMKTRENLRLARSRAFGMSKRVYRALGLRFVQNHLIDEMSDIFYLSEEEIASTVRGTAITQDLRQLIALRKREYEGFRKAHMGGRVVTHGIVGAASLGSDDIEVAAGSGDILRGQGCSPGRIAAKARVIHDPNSDLDIHDEILIAPMTDPGWVFLMVASKGLISEKGSLLSHTAIIGRELGIPTIVGVKDATRLIPNGQMIEIDGDAGTIRIASASGQ